MIILQDIVSTDVSFMVKVFVDEWLILTTAVKD